MDYIKRELPNVNLNFLKTNKFKTTRIKLTFANKLEEETVTKRALLAYMMRAISQSYKERQLMNQKLESLYAAGFSTSVDKKGLTHFITFDLSLINNNYTLHNENLLEEGLAFFSDVLFNPLFTEQSLTEEIRLLKEHHLNTYSNKIRYSLKQALKATYPDDLYQLSSIGKEEDLDSITLNDIKNTYTDMINNDTITCSVVGDCNQTELEQLIIKSFPFNNNKQSLTLIDHNYIEMDTKTIIERQSITQAKLVLTYHVPVYYGNEDYYNMVVLNSLIGGNSESLLFNRIREELSLVYFIGSLYDQYKGTLVIYAGINENDQKETIKEINQTIRNISNKEITPQSVEIAKTSLINGLIESYDSIGSLTQRINDLSLNNRHFDKDLLIQRINETTLEDLSRISKQITQTVTYLLGGEQDE